MLLQACKYMNAVGLPMYITETGVADHRDVLRPEMFETYFNQVCQIPSRYCIGSQ